MFFAHEYVSLQRWWKVGLVASFVNIAIWGTNPEKNAAASQRLATTGRRVFAAIADVGDEDAVVRAMAATVDTLGKVDSCFANAA